MVRLRVRIGTRLALVIGLVLRSLLVYRMGKYTRHSDARTRKGIILTTKDTWPTHLTLAQSQVISGLVELLITVKRSITSLDSLDLPQAVLTAECICPK